jgi:hypothetical protein
LAAFGLIPAQALPQTVETNAIIYSEPLHAGRINPRLFGNFIELLDDVVPAMWAEMLNDRSFEGVVLAANWSYYDGKPNFCDREWETNHTWAYDTERVFNGARAARLTAGRHCPASLTQSGLATQHGLAQIEGRRRLNDAGRQAVELAAGRLASLVDEALGKDGQSQIPEEPPGVPARQAATVAPCSCGSGIPVTMLAVDGQAMEVVALPLIMQRFHEAGRAPDDVLADELLKMVKIYNPVPEEAEASWREALLHEYQAYCTKEGQQ